MKNFTKSIVILIIFSLSFYSTKAQTEYKLDSIQQFQYDESFIPLQMTQRTHYTYEIGGVKPTEQIYLKKELGLWNNLYKFNITYNSDNNILSDNTKIWDVVNSIWLDSSKNDYEYDEFQNNTILTSYNYDGANWNFVHRLTQEFNENKQITYQLFEGVVPTTTEIFKSQNIYTYDENSNNTLLETQTWNSVTEIWDNNQKNESTYNGDLIMQQDSYIWTGTAWSVTPQSRQLYSYTSSDVYDVTSQSDSGSGLINGSKIFYTNNGIWPLEIEIKQWDTNSNSWLEDSKYTYSYDSNDNISNVFHFIWDISTYVLNGESRYFLSEAQPILGISTDKLVAAKAFPNPFKNELNLTLTTIIDSGATLQVFDAQGREVSNTTLRPGSKLIKLENSNLAKGLYFFKVSSKSQSEIFKVIKE